MSEQALLEQLEQLDATFEDLKDTLADLEQATLAVERTLDAVFTLNDVLEASGEERVDGGDAPFVLTDNGPVPLATEEEHPPECECEACGIARMEMVVEAEARIAMGE